MSLPKAELHLHIEGTLEPELAFALAARNGVALPYADTEELRKAYEFEDLQSFLNLYYELMAVLRTEQDFADLADAYLARAAAQGVRHAEIFFDPQAHIARGVGMGTIVEGLWRALRRSEETHGVLHSADHVLSAGRVRGVGPRHPGGREAVPRPDRRDRAGLGRGRASAGQVP